MFASRPPASPVAEVPAAVAVTASRRQPAWSTLAGADRLSPLSSPTLAERVSRDRALARTRILFRQAHGIPRGSDRLGHAAQRVPADRRSRLDANRGVRGPRPGSGRIRLRVSGGAVRRCALPGQHHRARLVLPCRRARGGARRGPRRADGAVRERRAPDLRAAAACTLRRGRAAGDRQAADRARDHRALADGPARGHP